MEHRGTSNPTPFAGQDGLRRVGSVARRQLGRRNFHPMHAPQERYLLVTFTDQLSPSAAECAE
jgi:hypothetical protein